MQKRPARSRLRTARCVESAPSLMKKDPNHNSTDSAEIEALITRIERGQLRDEDAQLLTRLLRQDHRCRYVIPSYNPDLQQRIQR